MQAHELSLNPVLLNSPIEHTLSWLARIMVQLQLFEQGNDYDYPQGYYTKAFSDAMWAIGLPCSSDGTPTGKRTGYIMRHWVDPTGKFKRSVKDIPENYFPWRGDRRRTSAGNKSLQYACEKCGLRIRTGKPMSGICTTQNCETPFKLIAS